MSTFTLKKNIANKFLGLFISIVYGFFVVFSLQRLYLYGSGDVNALVNFFEDIDIFTSFNTYSIRGDGLFRIGILFLGDLFNAEPITVLSCISFTMSSIFFYIYLVNIRSSMYLIYILPLFLLIFFTPMITNLFASAIRSGVAFTILMVAFAYFQGIKKYILFGLASFIHYSMLPIISLYVLFYTYKRLKIKSSFAVPFLAILSFSFIMTSAAYILKFNITQVSSSIFFNFLIFYVGLLIIFVNKKAVNNIYGFISIGLILVVCFGFILDISFLRYTANALVLYLFFLIKKGEAGTIQVFTIGYIPFFLLTLSYAIGNI